MVILGVLKSPVYTKQYEEFVNSNLIEENTTIYSSVPIYHTHAVQWEEEDLFSETCKKKFLPEVAAQFRSDEVLLMLEFKGAGMSHDGGGFSTDISDTCHWLTPFVSEPEDPWDLWYNSKAWHFFTI